MMMQAASYAAFGKAREVLVVGPREAPLAGPGEVLVRLATSAVNPSDVKKRAGSQPAALAALASRVKESFDPKRLFNPGRMG